MKTLINLFLTGLYIFFLIIISILPFSVLYVFSDIICFTICYIIKYRRKIIIKNLNDSFPGLSDDEINKLIYKVYQNLADVSVESIKAFTMSAKQIMRRHRVLQPEVADEYLQQNRSVIAVTGHIGNWEWGSLSASLFIKQNAVAFYKTLSNPFIDRFIRFNRSRTGTMLVSTKETYLTFQNLVNKASIYLMAADQRPGSANSCYSVPFFGRETPFLRGPEKYSRLYNYPVVFINIKRVKRGCYNVDIEKLVDDPASLPEGEITALYARKLESVIRENPENWLWSHNRWKKL